MPSSPLLGRSVPGTLLGRSSAWDSPFFARHVDAPPARHTEALVARPLVSIADDRSLLADAVHCRHGCKLMAVPRGVLGLTAMPPRPVGRLMRPPTRTRAKRGPRRGSMCGGDRAPSAPVFAAVEADARPNGRHAALHDAERDARCAGSLCLPAREVAHAERRWRMRGGSKTPPAEAAPPLRLGRKARFLRLVRGRLAATSTGTCSSSTSSRHISSPSNRP